MSTTHRNDGGGSATTSQPITVALTREHAPYVATVILGELEADLDSVRIVQSRTVVEQVRRDLDHDVALLEQIQWGEPPTDVTLKATREELTKFAGILMEGESYLEGLERLREQARKIAAGAAILDQIEATR